MTRRTTFYTTLLAALLAMAGGWQAIPVHADPTTPDKGKQGKGKGDGGSDIPIKVGPPIITKDPKSPPPKK